MILLIAAVVAIVLARAESRRWKLHPAIAAALERVKIGELTQVKGHEVVGAASQEARLEYLKAQRASDREGLVELADSGKIASLPEGTDVRVLERDESELDRLMNHVHALLDIDLQAYKDCLHENMRRTSAGLGLRPCGDESFDAMYNHRMVVALGGSTPEEVVEGRVLVLVRALGGKEQGKKYWLPFGSLSAPSRPDAPAEMPAKAVER
jgi:hypothetical protein